MRKRTISVIERSLSSQSRENKRPNSFLSIEWDKISRIERRRARSFSSTHAKDWKKMNFFESIRSLAFSKELVARKNGEVKEAKKKIEGFVKSVLGERSYRDLERLRRRNPTVVVD